MSKIVRKEVYSYQFPIALKHCLKTGINLGFVLFTFGSSILDLVLSLLSDLSHVISKAIAGKTSSVPKKR